MCNKKGFTLIEIIVSIMIASIGMVIATTLILNSMGYFNKTTVADHDKQAVDGIKDYVQDELMYATEIRVVSSSNAPEGEWYWLYIKDGRLYRGDYTDKTIETEVYGTDFYNRRTLKMTAKKFKVNRIDLSFAFLDDKASMIYKTKTTIELLNTELKSDADLSLQYLNTKDVDLLTDSDYRIYYKKGSLPINEKIDNEEEKPKVDDRTVGGEFNRCKNDENQKVWVDFSHTDKEKQVYYYKGDFVLYNKEYYRCISDNPILNISANAPDSGASNIWKKISVDFEDNSMYYKGDIVKHEFDDKIRYFQCVAEYTAAAQPPNKAINEWQMIDIDPSEMDEQTIVTKLIERTGLNPTCDFGKSANKVRQYTGTVSDEFYCFNLPSGKSYGDYVVNNLSGLALLNIKKGDFIAYNNFWYKALKDDAINKLPTTTDSGNWKKIRKYRGNDLENYETNNEIHIYDMFNSYEKNDIVQHGGFYYKVVHVNENNIVPKGQDPIFGKDNGISYWQQINETDLKKGVLNCN